MLKKNIRDDQQQALKNHDDKKLEILRYILAQIQNKEIEKKEELSDEETIAILKKIAKELKESIESSQKANRQELVNQYQNQLSIVKSYLPKEL